MILALNVGFYNTKVKTGESRVLHSTKVQENDNGSKTLILNDILYEVGVGSRDLADKQLSNVHRICTEYNILKYGDMNTSLVVALPMSHYLNRSYRAKYGDDLTGIHEGYVDGEYKKVNILKCTVFAEGAAAYLPYKQVLKDMSVGILDIGGATINCVVYEMGHLRRDTVTTLDLGMIRLERNLIDEINIAKGWNVQDYEVRDIIQNGECKEIVDRCIYAHINLIKQRLIEKQWNVDRLTMFCTGGGSGQIKEHLQNSLKVALVSDMGIWDNVEGLWLVGGALNK